MIVVDNATGDVLVRRRPGLLRPPGSGPKRRRDRTSPARIHAEALCLRRGHGSARAARGQLAARRRAALEHGRRRWSPRNYDGSLSRPGAPARGAWQLIQRAGGGRGPRGGSRERARAAAPSRICVS